MKNLMNRLIHKLTLKLIQYCERNNKVFIITGKGTDEPYLVRYLLVNSKYFNFYIHRFLRSDHDVPHDHPWDFITYVVDGRYIEEKYVDDSGWLYVNDTDFRKTYNPRFKGSLVYRKATDVHAVVVERALELGEIEKAPLTICITGPRIRNWGFWDGDMSNYGKISNARFIPWTNYLEIPDDSSKRG